MSPTTRSRNNQKRKTEAATEELREKSEHSSSGEEVQRDLKNRDQQQKGDSVKRIKPTGRPGIADYKQSQKTQDSSTQLSKDFENDTSKQNVRNLVPESLKRRFLSVKKSKDFIRIISAVLIIILAVLIIILYRYFIYDISSNESDMIKCMKSVKVRFPSQNEEFWRSIETSINFTVVENKPSSYVFLYESDAEPTIKDLLQKVSKCVVRALNESGAGAIDFQKEILDSPEFSKNDDYGPIITHLESKLQENGLMIIENLDKLPEKFALAFHVFCDAETPLVGKSAYFFTIKVDSLGESYKKDLQKAEEILRKQWKNMEDDKFEPLFTRISGMLLKVYPQHKV